MDSFSYLKVYISSQRDLESLDYICTAHIYHNLLKFNDSKIKYSQIMELTKYCYRIDVILQSLATTFVLGTISIQLEITWFQMI